MQKKEKIKRTKTKFEKFYIGLTVVVVAACLTIGLWTVYGDEIMTSASASAAETEEVQSDITVGITSTGDMTTYISASGTVSVPNTASVSLPIDGVIGEVYVQEGSLVKEGDLLYTITNSSLQSGMQALEEQLDTALDAASADDDSYTVTKIKATQDGIVKLLVAEEDLEVEDLLKENSKLAVISTAGTMYVDINTDTLTVGDIAAVAIGSETEEGVVVSVSDSIARIEIDTDEYDVNEPVSVTFSGSSVGEGKLQLTSYVAIQSPMGTIGYVYVEENDEVEQGDILFKVSVPDKSNVETFDEIDAMYESVAVMNEYIENGAVLAPYDGIVGTVSATEGQQMAADMSAVEIKPSSGFEVTISVDEDELNSIYLGQDAEITFADEYVLEGEIVHINYNAVTGTSSATFTVYVSLDECEEINQNKILPGMVGDVDIIINQSENAVRVPLEALFTDSNGTYVMLFTGDQDISLYEVYDIPTEICYVETGITSDLYAEVLSGLESGEQVIMVSSSNSDAYSGFMNRDFSGMDFGNKRSESGMPQGAMPGN